MPLWQELIACRKDRTRRPPAQPDPPRQKKALILPPVARHVNSPDWGDCQFWVDVLNSVLAFADHRRGARSTRVPHHRLDSQSASASFDSGGIDHGWQRARSELGPSEAVSLFSRRRLLRSSARSSSACSPSESAWSPGPSFRGGGTRQRPPAARRSAANGPAGGCVRNSIVPAT